jgi:hypothetical protein
MTRASMRRRAQGPFFRVAISASNSSSVAGGTVSGVRRARRRALDGHFETHKPQPMQRSALIFAAPSPRGSFTAFTWQRATHFPHREHFAPSISARKLLVQKSTGCGNDFCIESTPQQQPQQEQTNPGRRALAGWSTSPSS